MPIYLLSLNDSAQREQLVRLSYNLARLIPGVAVSPALRIEAGDGCLDSVMLQIGAVRIDTPQPAAVIEEVAAVKEVARIEKAVEKKERHQVAPTGICSQCDQPGVLTKAGICKPCAMRKGRSARKTPENYSPSGPVVIVEEQRATERFAVHHGAIKGRKLG